MPTEKHVQELLENTEVEYVYDYEGNGVNGNTIFMPFAGCIRGEYKDLYNIDSY